ncbi:hypothetical protein D3C78_557380 [compost metagenome]
MASYITTKLAKDAVEDVIFDISLSPSCHITRADSVLVIHSNQVVFRLASWLLNESVEAFFRHSLVAVWSANHQVDLVVSYAILSERPTSHSHGVFSALEATFSWAVHSTNVYTIASLGNLEHLSASVHANGVLKALNYSSSCRSLLRLEVVDVAILVRHVKQVNLASFWYRGIFINVPNLVHNTAIGVHKLWQHGVTNYVLLASTIEGLSTFLSLISHGQCKGSLSFVYVSVFVDLGDRSRLNTSLY